MAPPIVKSNLDYYFIYGPPVSAAPIILSHFFPEIPSIHSVSISIPLLKLNFI